MGSKEESGARVTPFWKVHGSLTICDNLLLFSGRIVVPQSLQKETMEKIHEGHEGIDRCRARVKSSVWWPGIDQHISQKVQQCQSCCKKGKSRKEPLQLTPFQIIPSKWLQQIFSSWKVFTIYWLLTTSPLAWGNEARVYNVKQHQYHSTQGCILTTWNTRCSKE